jgi:hypothetical protein
MMGGDVTDSSELGKHSVSAMQTPSRPRTVVQIKRYPGYRAVFQERTLGQSYRRCVSVRCTRAASSA